MTRLYLKAQQHNSSIDGNIDSSSSSNQDKAHVCSHRLNLLDSAFCATFFHFHDLRILATNAHAVSHVLAATAALDTPSNFEGVHAKGEVQGSGRC
jgi:hypothetical protein